MAYIDEEIELKGATHRPKGARSYYDLLSLLWMHRRIIARLLVAGMLAALIVSLLIPNKFESTVRVLAPEANSGLMGLAAMLGGGKDSAALSAASQLFETKSSDALSVDVLRGSTVEDALINQFDLRRHYWTRYYKVAREKLEKRTEITEDKKSGLITITVTDESQARAQQMARAYVSELDRILTRINTSSAGRQRAFIETRLNTVKQELQQAEVDMSAFQMRTGTIELEQQTKATVDSIARLQAELISAQAELEGLQQIYTHSSISVKTANARVEELRRELDKLVGSGGPDASTNNPSINLKTSEIAPPIRRMPIIAVQYLNLYRDFKVKQAVFELLTQQYEMAKIEEAKDIRTIRVVDDAGFPEKKSWPPRTIIVIGAGFAVLLVTAFYIVTRERVAQLSEEHPASRLWYESHRYIHKVAQKLRRRQGMSKGAAAG